MSHWGTPQTGAANVSLPGAVNGQGDPRANFYKVFTGEVLTAFDRKNVMKERHRIRNIRNQKSASFANTGQARGRIHVPGTEILGQNMQHNETIITVDDLLISDVFIADLYEAMNHYEVRRDYSHQLGTALSRTFDKQTMRVAARAAREPNKITGLPGGTSLFLGGGYGGLSDADKAIAMADALFNAHQTFLEHDVDPSDCFAIIRPDTYFRLVRNKDLLNRDYGGLGSYAQADLPMVAGIPLVVSNNLPNQDDGANTSTEVYVPGNDGVSVVRDGIDYISTKYADDYTDLEAVIMKPEAIGTVMLIDLTLQSQYDMRRQGTLMLARMALGHGTLRPECAIEVRASDAPGQ